MNLKEEKGRMRILLSIAFTTILPLVAQEPVAGIPRIDLIEFYGLRTVTTTLARQALGVAEGDPLPASKINTEERLLDIDRVTGASLEAVCCDEGRNILYVGIEERGSPRLEIRPAPGGAIVLPDGVVTAYRNFEQASHAAALSGKTGEDLTQGHPLTNDPAVRALQQRFPALVQTNIGPLRDVLRESTDDYERGIAAYLLPYATDKASIVEDLHAALTDNDPGVRSKAIHGLTALALFGRSNPASRVRVQPAWFLDSLQSVAWTDRTQAAWAFELLTRNSDAATLRLLRGDALTSLAEMARWRTEQHAYPAFTLIGRVAGLSDVEIRDAWLRGGRDSTIAKALATK